MKFDLSGGIVLVGILAMTGCAGMPAAPSAGRPEASGMTTVHGIMLRQLPAGDHLQIAQGRSIAGLGGSLGLQANGYTQAMLNTSGAYFTSNGNNGMIPVYTYRNNVYPYTYASNGNLYGMSYCPYGVQMNWQNWWSTGATSFSNWPWLPTFATNLYAPCGCAPTTTTLSYNGSWFYPQSISCPVGSTVTWNNPTGQAMSMSYGSNSYTIPAYGSYQMTFSKPGLYSYILPDGGQANVNVTSNGNVGTKTGVSVGTTASLGY